VDKSTDTLSASASAPALRTVVPATAASIRDLRNGAREFARRAGAEDGVAADVALAISEAATNVVLHAYGEGEGTVEVTGRHDGRWLEFEVSDEGGGFRPSPLGGLGFGLKVMADVSDSMTVRQRDKGTTIFLRFARVREAKQRRER
jgi:anti-sigma regulatory factor (Ser/Thr protein kinase)